MTELPTRPVRGNEFQTDGAENRKARLEKSVLVNGCTSSGMAGEWMDADTLRGSESWRRSHSVTPTVCVHVADCGYCRLDDRVLWSAAASGSRCLVYGTGYLAGTVRTRALSIQTATWWLGNNSDNNIAHGPIERSCHWITWRCTDE